MKVSSLGHTGLKVEAQNCRILVNPWLSPEGAFLASWFQYPDNQHLVVPSLFEPDAIIISHEYLDHLDPWFLAQIPSHIPVIIPKYPSPVLYQKIAAAGGRIIQEKASWEVFQIAETRIFFVAAASPMHHAAAIVMISDGQSLLNLNNVQLTPCQLYCIQSQVQAIDLLMLRGQTAPWFPLCYGYPPDRQQHYCQQGQIAQFHQMAQAIRRVQPKMAIPLVSSPCFLDRHLRHWNQEADGLFPEPQQIGDWLHSQGIDNTVLLLPGDSWDLTTCTKATCPIWNNLRSGDRQCYLESYAQRRAIHIERVMSRYPEPDRDLWQPFQEYFTYLLSLSPYFNQKINLRIGFDILGAGGGQWTVDFRSNSQGVCDRLEDCSYLYRFASRWLTALLNGTLLWEDFFFSLRFQIWRELEAENDYLFGLLKLAHPTALKAVEDYEQLNLP